MPRAIHCSKHPKAADTVKPVKIPRHNIAWAVKHSVVTEHGVSLQRGGQNRLLDALCVFDAVSQITVKRLNPLSLMFHFCCAGLHLRFEFCLVCGEVIAHFQNRSAERVLLAQWGVFGLEIPATDFKRKRPSGLQAISQAIDREGHLTDFVAADPHR